MTEDTKAGCCCPGEDETPRERNAPGLSALTYRIGGQPALLRGMLEEISRWTVPDSDPPRRPLRALTTRSLEDPAIALMDAWAVAADVLSFYQERIANEGFLRTATERLSVRELARQIGYSLKPGVAAAVYLAWKVEERDPAPASAEVPAGTQVQSVPAGPGELPQTFETAEGFTAWRKWNALKLRPSVAQVLSPSAGELLLAGTSLGIRRGDLMVLRSSSAAEAKKVLDVTEDLEAARTRVNLASGGTLSLEAEWPAFPEGERVEPGDALIALTAEAVEAEILGKTWEETPLREWLDYHGWDEGKLLGYLEELKGEKAQALDILKMQEALGFCGQNAPRYLSLPDDVRTVGTTADATKAYPYNWDDAAWTIWKDSLTNADYSDAAIILDREMKDLMPGQTLVIENKAAERQVLTIASAGTFAMNGFALPLKVTGVSFDSVSKDADYYLKSSRAYAGEKAFLPAEEIISGEIPAGSDQLVLSGMVLGLSTGGRIAISGEISGASGKTHAQIATLKTIEHSGGYTRLTLEEGLEESLERSSVVLNANVTLATHGETVAEEILGSSDGARPHQRFLLKKPPLTYVSADTPSGSESTMEVRVNGVLWHAAASLYHAGKRDRAYEVKHTEAGEVIVQFGDGAKGSIPPTVIDGIRARYRSGIGLGGEVGEGAITLMKKKPFGARAVVNPKAASGAEDPESMEDARENAPRTVRTLDRVVSVEDYVDYSRGFAGIGKAAGTLIWMGRRQVVHLSLLTASGAELDDAALDTFRKAIDKVRDPYQDLEARNGRHGRFRLKMGVLIHPDHLWEDVEARLRADLVEAYGFEKRDFGLAVHASEVIALCNGLAGVEALDIEELAMVGGPVSPLGIKAFLPAPAARVDAAGEVHPAEILTLDPVGIELERRTSL